VTDQFTNIIEKKKEEPLLAFLKTLTPQDKKQLVPLIKKMDKEYREYGPLGGGSYGHIKGTDGQRDMLLLAAFVCFNRAEYDKLFYGAWMVDKERLSKVIDWYCPEWFSDYVNKQADADYISSAFEYFWLMELAERGFLYPGKLLIIKTLPEVVFESVGPNKWQLKPEVLLRLPITLHEHIWYLFELESNLHFAERYRSFGAPESEKAGWLKVLKDFADQEKIDRFRVLRQSLLASNRNFNKNLSGWFAELFSELEPANEELLLLQNELLSALGSPHSKPVNTALQAIRKIVAEKAFDAQGLLDATPLLLASDTKATVNSTLAALEKLGRNHPAWWEKIARMGCQCFIHQAEELQTKAAKIIAKFGATDDQGLREELQQIRSNMLATTRQTLAAFLDIENENSATKNDQTNTETAGQFAIEVIPFPATIDDVIFLASQAFDNNEPWHLDALPAALVHFAPTLKEQDLPLFGPAFQRALKTMKGALGSNCGALDHLLAAFFIDFGNWLIGKFGPAAETISEVYQSFDGKTEENRTSFLVSPPEGTYLARWEPYNKLPIYQPYKHLLLEALEKIRNADVSPVLSMPTHAPCWIEPNVLITRLRHYQELGKAPSNMDIQIAISRCALPGTDHALKLAEAQLTGEFKALMTFLLEEHAPPVKSFQYKSAWLIAALTRKDRKMWPEFGEFALDQKVLDNYTGRVPWSSVVESYQGKRWDYQLRKDIEEPAFRKILRVDREHQRTGESMTRRFFFRHTTTGSGDLPFLYPFLQFKTQYLTSEPNDIQRIMALVPNNPEPLLADTINKCLQYPAFWEESDKKMVSSAVRFLYSIWHSPGPMTYLFLATCMLSGDKTVAGTAGEIWLMAVSVGAIDNCELGGIIGRHESIEFAPLKRFTDLVNQHLLKVSPRHDIELQTLIEQVILRLPDEPVKNLKKLLDIYSELLAVNKSSLKSEGVLARLKIWEGIAGLQRTILSIRK